MKKRALIIKLKPVFIFLIIAFVGLGLVRVYNADRFHLEKQTRFMMDTYVTIYVVGPKKTSSLGVNLALERMQEVSIKFNLHNPKSPIYLFNQQNIPISDPEILKVVRLALQVSKDSKGAFDITCFPLTQLWGFSAKSPHLPSEQAITEALKNVGYRHLLIDNGKLKKDEPGVTIDLGGIAKGYAVSEAAKALKGQGVTSAIIDAGGDVYALGRKGRNKLWRVGIRDPFNKESLLGYLEVEDLAVMGSGDYERFFTENGKKYHHIFNPHTGYPAQALAGITVIYPEPVLADAWATALFVLGPKEGMDMAKQIPGLEAIMVTASGEILYSSGLKDVFKAVPKE